MLIKTLVGHRGLRRAAVRFTNAQNSRNPQEARKDACSDLKKSLWCKSSLAVPNQKPRTDYPLTSLIWLSSMVVLSLVTCNSLLVPHAICREYCEYIPYLLPLVWSYPMTTATPFSVPVPEPVETHAHDDAKSSETQSLLAIHNCTLLICAL